MKLPLFFSKILKLIEKQHIGLRLVLYVVLLCCFVSLFNWVKSTMNQQAYALEAFGQGKQLVLFHWNQCGYCKKMMPAWNELKKKYNGSIGLKDYESTANPDIMKENKIDGYPTIILFNNGKQVQKYEGGRSTDEFMAFLQKNE